MATVALPILLPRGSPQRYSCHGCGNCCRDFTVQLRDEDVARLAQQGWTERLGEPVTVEFRGRTYLRQRDDGGCIFWMPDGRCRIHAEFGFEAKPIACQLFPFSLAPGADGLRVGLNFACQSVLEDRGATLESHAKEIRRMVAAVPEAQRRTNPPLLAGSLRAEDAELEAIERVVDGWLADSSIPIAVRLDGLAWLVQSLRAARLEGVRGRRFVELVELLRSALPDELALLEHDAPGRRAWRMLRQAAHARIEDLRIADAARQGRLRSVLGQLRRSRRFASGRGEMPAVVRDWPQPVRFASVMQVGSAEDPAQRAAIEDLLVRWLRCTILGGRAWGTGFYGWSVVDGLGALLLNLLGVLWLARAHAAGAGRSRLDIADLRAALGRVDRHAGRAAWLGSSGERLRIGYLQATESWRGLLAALQPV